MTATRRRDPDVLADLEEQRHFLLRSIDDLERERAAGDIDDEDYVTLSGDYTRRAAGVLRAIDEGKTVPAVGPGRVGRWRRLVGAGVVAAVAVAAGLGVAAASGARRPGETVSGDIAVDSSGQLAQAAALARDGRFTEALELYDDVLDGDPRNVEALSERGLLLVSLASATQRPALADAGRESIEGALELDPDDPRSRFYLGLVLRLQGDDAGAQDAFRRALAADPPPALRQSIEGFTGPPDAGAP